MRLLSVLAVFVSLLLLISPADSKGLKKAKKDQPSIENYEPPAENAEIEQCEPIREKVVSLNKHTPKYARIFIVPEREYLMAKHRRCKAKLMSEEFQYLKHVDIKNPTLNPLPNDTDALPSEEK